MVQQSSQQSSGREGRLKDVVGAFVKAGKGKEARSERKRQGGKGGSGKEADLMMGYGGREFADVDCKDEDHHVGVNGLLTSNLL